jgi:hypothetical protein
MFQQEKLLFCQQDKKQASGETPRFSSGPDENRQNGGISAKHNRYLATTWHRWITVVQQSITKQGDQFSTGFINVVALYSILQQEPQSKFHL